MAELLDNLDTKGIKEEVTDDENVLKPKKVKQVCSQKKLDALKNNRIKAEEAKSKNKEEKQLKYANEIIEKDKQKNILKENDLKPLLKNTLKEKDLKPLLKNVDQYEAEPVDSGESDSEVEVVVVKKKQKIKEKPKKKKKIITIEISDSESDSEEDEPEPVKKQRPLAPRQMVSQQNKKSLIKVHKPVEQINYFCD